MNDFLKFFDETVQNFPLHLVITYNKIEDWTIQITKFGCADIYPNSERYGDDALICNVSGCDMELCFERAYVALKEWLLENKGGY